MKTLPVGLQIYTIRDYAERNFAAAMKAVKAMGYDFAELAGLYGHTPAEIKAALDDAGLKAISAHVPLAELIEDTEKTIDNYIYIGVKSIAVPYLGEGQRPGDEGFDKLLAEIERIGKTAAAKGVTLLYHNHDFEFIKMANGEFGLDYMYSTVGADALQTELDTCWVKVAGECPVGYIKKYAGRCPVVHLKDFVGEKTEGMYELIGINKKAEAKKEAFAFRPVGHGVQDFPAILAAAVESGAEYVVVEQDRWDCESLEAARLSREYLKSIGW